MSQASRETLRVAREKAVLVACILPGAEFDPHDPLGELSALADTAGAIVVDQLMQNRTKPEAATFIGSGKVQELGEMVKVHKADVIIFDNDLSPSQIGNVEKVCECKVLDRSELILDIFAARAKSYEAKLQVELAQLEYTYPRLRAMWSHLERIVGGAPAGIGTRGPGEQQLEIDRRIVQRKKSDLKREISKIQARKQREVAHRNEDFFTVGLVGYTNAGKSTLFNTVTGGEAYADDKLFATLSTRTRQWELGGGDNVMLSDTVGFVKNLPHHLVASFRATLEEAVHADLLLVVMDVAHPQAGAQLKTVMRVLDEIGADEPKRLVALNKIDKLVNNTELLIFQQQYPDAVSISAKSGRGVEQLVEKVRGSMQGLVKKMVLSVPIADGRAVSLLENRAQVLERDYGGERARFTVRIGERQLAELRSLGKSLRVEEGEGDQTPQGKGWGR